MQKEFNKMSLDKQRKFIVRNMLKDEHFKDLHDAIKIYFVEDMHSKSKLNELIKIRNSYVNEKITKLLRKYKENILDLYSSPNNFYYYNLALKNKNKIQKIINNTNILSYKDEFGFMISELLIDTYADTKNILINQELSLDFIAKNIHG